MPLKGFRKPGLALFQRRATAREILARAWSAITDPLGIHRLFHGAAAAPWLLLLVIPSPVLILALGGLSVMSIAAGSLVRIARLEAENKILWDLKALGTDEPATDALYRIIDSDVVKAVGTVEVVGNRMLYELTSPEGRPSDPRFQHQMTIWLGFAAEDLAIARKKLRRRRRSHVVALQGGRSGKGKRA